MTDTDDDLVSSLGTYGAFLEAEAGAQLRPVFDGVELLDDTVEPEPGELFEFPGRTRSGPPVLVVAAGLLLLLGGVFAVREFTGSADSLSPTAESQELEPLFVLPSLGSGVTVSDGYVDRFRLSNLEGEPPAGGMIGRPVENGYVDLIRINVATDPAEYIEIDNFEQVGETSIYRSLNGPLEQVMQDRDGVVVLLSTLRDSLADPEVVLDEIVVDSDRNFVLGDGSEFVLIDQWVLDPEVQRGQASLDVSTAGTSFIVQTGEVPAASGFDAISLARQILIDGQPAWLTGVDGESYAISWQATPTHSVFISRSDDQPSTEAELVALVESLEIVDRETWFAAIESQQQKEASFDPTDRFVTTSPDGLELTASGDLDPKLGLPEVYVDQAVYGPSPQPSVGEPALVIAIQIAPHSLFEGERIEIGGQQAVVVDQTAPDAATDLEMTVGELSIQFTGNGLMPIDQIIDAAEVYVEFMANSGIEDTIPGTIGPGLDVQQISQTNGWTDNPLTGALETHLVIYTDDSRQLTVRSLPLAATRFGVPAWLFPEAMQTIRIGDTDAVLVVREQFSWLRFRHEGRIIELSGDGITQSELIIAAQNLRPATAPEWNVGSP